MLVISRKISEGYQIGENITVTVVDIRGDRVRLGVKAPEGISVHRREVQNKVDSNKQKTAKKPHKKKGHLVLSRKVGEEIVIDNNIVVTVTEIRIKNVSLGTDAPKKLIIRRLELPRKD